MFARGTFFRSANLVLVRRVKVVFAVVVAIEGHELRTDGALGHIGRNAFALIAVFAISAVCRSAHLFHAPSRVKVIARNSVKVAMQGHELCAKSIRAYVACDTLALVVARARLAFGCRVDFFRICCLKVVDAVKVAIQRHVQGRMWICILWRAAVWSFSIRWAGFFLSCNI